jgi:hypothetical protein
MLGAHALAARDPAKGIDATTIRTKRFVKNLMGKGVATLIRLTLPCPLPTLRS